MRQYPVICAPVFLLLLTFFSCEKKMAETDAANEYEMKTFQSSKPNIIFIVADDVGYEIPTVNGGRSYSTPHIDKLAERGMRFTQCRSTPLCSPSRFMLLTGKYNFRNYTEWGQMEQSQRTIGNMLRKAGYATCYAGKWQLDGGDESIHRFGFEKYSVWLPFYRCTEKEEGSRYKSAKIYQDGGYLPDSITNGKYAPDEFAEYIDNFIEENQDKPFFIYYSMILCHGAWSPTPDDPEYENWEPDPRNSHKKYFPSMVKYMDKKIGMLVDKLKALNIENNTVIFFVGDNGTPDEITSQFHHRKITGAKAQSIEYGIHVPLIVKWPQKISPHTENNDLIDFTDFLPTLADIANIPKPTHYGPLDGISFYPQLKGNTGTPRNSIFTHFNPNNICVQPSVLKRYCQDSTYKLYDGGNFYRFTKDPFELNPLKNSELTQEQREIKQNFQSVMDEMHN